MYFSSKKPLFNNIIYFFMQIVCIYKKGKGVLMLKFNKILLSSLMFVCVIFLYSCNSNVKDNTAKSESKINVAVSIVPEETFVKEVGGDKIEEVFAIRAGRELRVVV